MLLNGEPTGETRLNALLCGHFGVPVAFVAGDDTVCREAKNVLGDDLPTFAVKDGIDMFTANCLHPEVSQKGFERASRPRFETWEAPGLHDGFAGHVRLRVQLDDNRGDLRVHPGVSKPSPYTTEFTTDNMPSAMKVIFAELLLALQVGQKGIYS